MLSIFGMEFDIYCIVTQKYGYMEYYTTTAQIETHTIMLIIGLAIMLIGGYFVSLLVKDENKMAKWLVGVVTVGGILTSGSVLAMALGF